MAKIGAEDDGTVIPPPPPGGSLPPLAGDQKAARVGSINISGVPELADWDKDGDGTIDAKEVLMLLDVKKNGDKIMRAQKFGLGVMSLIVVACAITLGVLLGQQGSQTRDELSKQGNETRASTRHEIHEQRLGDANQTEPLPSQWAGDENATRPSLLVDRDGNPIRTDQSYDRLEMSSTIPDPALYKLEQLVISGPSGTINFKTIGFARYTTKDSIHGSVVVVCQCPRRRLRCSPDPHRLSGPAQSKAATARRSGVELALATG